MLAHREGSRRAAELFEVVVPTDADIVVANTYPFDANLWFVPWGTWPLMSTRPEVTRVALADGSQGAGSHRLKPTELGFLGRAWVRFRTLRPRHVLKQVRHLVTSLTRTRSRKMLDFLMVCPNISEEDMALRFPAATLYRSWNDLQKELESRYGDRAVKVAVLPCAPLQFEKKSQGD